MIPSELVCLSSPQFLTSKYVEYPSQGERDSVQKGVDEGLLKETLKDGIMGTWKNEPLTQLRLIQTSWKREGQKSAKANQVLTN